MPSLSSSRDSAGQPTAAASRWASVVLPDPAGPLTTINVGRLTSSLTSGTRQLWPASRLRVGRWSSEGARPIRRPSVLPRAGRCCPSAAVQAALTGQGAWPPHPSTAGFGPPLRAWGQEVAQGRSFNEEFHVLNLPYPLPLCRPADRSSKRCRRVGERSEDRSACLISFTLLVVVGDQGLGRTVLLTQRLLIPTHRGGHLEGELLAELDAPLIKAVDAPHHPLDEGDVFIQRDQLPDDGWRQGRRHDRGGGPVAGEHPRRHDGLRSALGADLLGGFPEGQRRGLGEKVREEELMDVAFTVPKRMRRVRHGDEVRGNHPGALVDELVERMLPVGAGLAPEDLTRVGGHR